LKIYSDSPDIGVMRAPEDFYVLGVTGDAFKGKKYYLCDDYRPSDDGAYGGWNRLYGSVFRKLRDPECCAISYSRRNSGKNNHRTGYYTINCFHGRLREVRADESSDDSLSDDDCEKRVLKRKRQLDTPSDDSGQIIPVSEDVVPDRVQSSYRGDSLVNYRVNRRPHRTKGN
jgi:hypothetical protein